jgi:ParB family chromosome partitioning protein
MATKKKRPATASGKPRARRGVKLRPTELSAQELLLTDAPPEVRALAEAVTADGGAVLATYREPLGGHPLLFVALPLERVSATPFQRDVSDAHVLKLTRAMDKTRRYLDPIIAVRKDGAYLTPNGNHRLTVLRELGCRTIVALLVPEVQVAYQILALNIEKAHNLREKSLEVVRMYRELATLGDQKETDLELELEEPQLVTLGFGYEARGRLSGGAYQPILKRVDGWIPRPLRDALPERERRAAVLLAFDDAVNEAVAKLKARGLQSPYLKAFVVARCNPLRFIKGEPPPFDELFSTMTRRCRGMKLDSIGAGEVARSGGAPEAD